MFVASDARPSYLNPAMESSRTAGGCNQGAAVEADAIGELQSKWTQLGNSS